MAMVLDPSRHYVLAKVLVDRHTTCCGAVYNLVLRLQKERPMSLFDDFGPQDFEELLVLLRVYRQRIEKARSIIFRAVEVGDYSSDTISDIQDALDGEYDT